MTVTINGTTGITSPEVVLDNAAADGGQVVLKSSGYSNWNWDNYSGRLRAYYNATEYFTIDASGNVLVGSTTYNGGNQGGIQVGGGSTGVIYIGHANGTTGGATFAAFNYNGSAIGSITQNGTTGVLYNITSDYRLKNNPVALTGAKEFVMALQPKTWDWHDGSGKGVGFIAHEFMEVAKHSGNGEKDAVDVDGNPVYQSIQPSSSEVVANLVAFIQEQQTTITALTARIEALEAKNA